MPVTERLFADGAMWEGGPWKLVADRECSAYGGGKPCPHCHSARDKVHTRLDKSTYTEPVWTCPRVVIAYNEGGYNSTGVCLDCILAACCEPIPCR